MRKKSNRSMIITATVLSALLFCSCGKVDDVPAQESTVAVENEVNAEPVSEPQTIDEVRELIASIDAATDKEQDMDTLLQCYGELRNRDALEKEDYPVYESLCSRKGDNALGYELLVEEYEIYPSEEVIHRLESYIVVSDKKAVGALAGQVRDQMKALAETDISEIREEDDEETAYKEAVCALQDTLSTTEWRQTFGLYDGVIEKKTVYREDGFTLQVSQQDVGCLVEVLEDGASYSFAYVCDDTASLVIVKGEGFAPTSGSAIACTFDQDGFASCKITSGLTENGVLTGSLECLVEDAVYHGTFDAQGHAKVEQPENFQGQMIYAYDDEKEACLYVEADTQDKVFTIADFGFTSIDVWEVQ